MISFLIKFMLFLYQPLLFDSGYWSLFKIHFLYILNDLVIIYMNLVTMCFLFPSEAFLVTI